MRGIDAGCDIADGRNVTSERAWFGMNAEELAARGVGEDRIHARASDVARRPDSEPGSRGAAPGRPRQPVRIRMRASLSAIDLFRRSLRWGSARGRPEFTSERPILPLTWLRAPGAGEPALGRPGFTWRSPKLPLTALRARDLAESDVADSPARQELSQAR